METSPTRPRHNSKYTMKKGKSKKRSNNINNMKILAPLVAMHVQGGEATADRQQNLMSDLVQLVKRNSATFSANDRVGCTCLS